MSKKKKKVEKILVVEDDALLANVLSQNLVSAGAEVMVVANGLEVEDAVKKFAPQAVLLDLILPGIDGFEVLKRLKGDEQTKEIPVIVLSNIDNLADVKSVKALGAEEFFIKANTQLEKITKYVMEQLEIAWV